MRFCGTCGQQIPDDARACPYCGAAQTGGAPAPVKAKKPFPMKAVILGLAGLVAVLAIVLVLTKVLGNNYKQPLDTMVKAFNAQKADEASAKKAAGAFVGGTGSKHLNAAIATLYDLEDEDGQTFEEVLQDKLDEQFDDLKDTYGDDVQISYTIEDEERMDDETLDDYRMFYKNAGKMAVQASEYGEDHLDELEDAAGAEVDEDTAEELLADLKAFAKELKEAKVSDGYLLDLEIKIAGSEDEDTRELSIAVVKLDGKWVISMPHEDLGQVNTALGMFDFEDLLEYAL